MSELVEPVGGRDVARQGESGQRGEGSVGRAAEPGLDHPAAPDRDPVRLAQIVDPSGVQVAADPAGLDVDHLRGPQRDRVGGRPDRDHRFVKADRGSDQPGEFRVLSQVVLGQRLFDQQQIERVQPAQHPGIGQRVGRVGVDLQQDQLAEPLPDGLHRRDVPAGFDLQLDPDVAVGQVVAHHVEQGGDRRLDADRDAGRYRGPDRPEVAGERLPGAAQLRVQHGHLQRGLRHPVPDDRLEQRIDQLGGDVPAGRRRRPAAAGSGSGATHLPLHRRTPSCTAAAPSPRIRPSPAPRPGAVVAPRPGTVPTTRIRTAIRSDSTPNEVSNGLTNGILMVRSSTPVIFMIGSPRRRQRSAVVVRPHTNRPWHPGGRAKPVTCQLRVGHQQRQRGAQRMPPGQGRFRRGPADRLDVGRDADQPAPIGGAGGRRTTGAPAAPTDSRPTAPDRSSRRRRDPAVRRPVGPARSASRVPPSQVPDDLHPVGRLAAVGSVVHRAVEVDEVGLRPVHRAGSG